MSASEMVTTVGTLTPSGTTFDKPTTPGLLEHVVAALENKGETTNLQNNGKVKPKPDNNDIT